MTYDATSSDRWRQTSLFISSYLSLSLSLTHAYSTLSLSLTNWFHYTWSRSPVVDVGTNIFCLSGYIAGRALTWPLVNTRRFRVKRTLFNKIFSTNYHISTIIIIMLVRGVLGRRNIRIDISLQSHTKIEPKSSIRPPEPLPIQTLMNLFTRGNPVYLPSKLPESTTTISIWYW